LFDLGIDIGKQGVQRTGGLRANPIHLMNITPLDLRDHPDRLCVCDDYIMMPLQSVTQWDGLAHLGYDECFYNNTPASSVTTVDGSTRLSIHRIASRGVIGRGVLLDCAAFKHVDLLPGEERIDAAMLDAVCTSQNVQVGAGDIVLVRTGWIRHVQIGRAIDAYWHGEPGLTLDCAEWLHARDVAAVASDNWGVEFVRPDRVGGLPLHAVLIRDMGMTLGEIFDLERLAEDCRRDGIWEFLFTAPPLKVVGGVGSPITPLAVK
jgi:kynurenine formamidase